MSRLLATLLLAYVLGFALFTSTLPRAAAEDVRTDGIVVLTGGPGRVQRGLALLADGSARRMLVSGVDPQVRRSELARTYGIPESAFARVDLGRESVDTRSNADEAARWIAAHGYHSIRLVTTDWHMPRARLELARSIPTAVTMIPDAVASEPGLVVLMREYNKYLLRLGVTLAERARSTMARFAHRSAEAR